jgi:hypothetical protein
MDLRNVGILSQHDTEDGGNMDVRNVGTLPQHDTEDGGNMDLRNVGTLPQHYTASLDLNITAVKASKLASVHEILF